MALADPPQRDAGTETPSERIARPTVQLDGSEINLEDSNEITAAHVKAMLAQTNRKADGFSNKTRMAFTAESSTKLKLPKKFRRKA